MKPYRVRMHTKPAIGQEFYRGSVRVFAENDADAIAAAKREALRVHPGREFIVERVEAGGDR